MLDPAVRPDPAQHTRSLSLRLSQYQVLGEGEVRRENHIRPESGLRHDVFRQLDFRLPFDENY